MNSEENKHVEKKAFRISKFLGKTVLGALLLLFLLIAIIHIPAVQKQITRKLSTYLTNKIQSEVQLKNLSFSLLGNVEIDELTLWDRENKKIFHAGKIVVVANSLNFIRGNLIFDQILISDFDGELIQTENGLNIQFILDSFKSNDNKNTTSKNVKLQFRNVILENFKFKFNSSLSGTNVALDLKNLTIHAGELSTIPLAIKADTLNFSHSDVKVLTVTQPAAPGKLTSSKNKNPFSPDFGIGLVFEIKNFKIKDSNFSFNKNKITTPDKFDPSHISLKNIQINLSDFLIRSDTLALVLHSLSTEMPGFKIIDAGTTVNLNYNKLNLSGFHLASNAIQLNANLKSHIEAISDTSYSINGIFSLKSSVNVNDLTYLLPDSILNYFKNWGTTEFEAEGNYNDGLGELKVLNLNTAQSQFYAAGKLNDILDLKKINWEELTIRSTVGPDFHRTVSLLVKDSIVPPDLKLDLITTGNTHQVKVDGEIYSAWGNVIVKGSAAQISKNYSIDMNVNGRKVLPGKWIDTPWLGSVDFQITAKGILGQNQDAVINGVINAVEIQEQSISDINFRGTVKNKNLIATVSIEDPEYCSDIYSEVLFADTLLINNQIRFSEFKIGRLIKMDSTLFISGNINSQIKSGPSLLSGNVEVRHLLLKNNLDKYSPDSIDLNVLLSPAESHFYYTSDDINGNLDANFDLRDSMSILHTWTKNIFNNSHGTIYPAANQALNFNFKVDDVKLLKIFVADITKLSSLNLLGEFDAKNQKVALQASASNFNGYGFSLDSLKANFTSDKDKYSASASIDSLVYQKYELGDLYFDLKNNGDTAITNLLLSKDSISKIDISTRILPFDSGVFIFPEKLMVFENEYFFDWERPLYLKNKSLVFDNFKITRNDMQIDLNGDINAFDANFKNIKLSNLNPLLLSDTTIISNGTLNGMISYSTEHHLQLKADIDNLSLYNSSPFTIAMSAKSNEDQIPFSFELKNSTNKIDLHGVYQSDNDNIKGSLLADINNPELFSFLYKGILDNVTGSIKVEADIGGKLKKPQFKGYVGFQNTGITTSYPKFTFNIQEDKILIDSSGIYFKDFTIYDKGHNPLIIDGNLNTKDYENFAYDLSIRSDNYALINNPDTTKGQLKGLFVIDSDIKLKGNQKDTYIKAKVTIKDTTNLTFVNSNDKNELLNTLGIVEFVDPAVFLDSTLNEQSTSFYDSLLATLPDFNLSSTIILQEDAKLRIITDPQSGDYFEASGGAHLELGYDRTGNARLEGDYVVKKGLYRLSFYDLVKRNFELTPGSSIKWSGNPENGELDIKAVNTVKSNSLGLIGDEVGDNEKAAYKRSLPYEVGIIIKGTVDKPIVTFSLDLPEADKVSYPVLASKLDRLKQPEYQSELNKQVFGLLVLGGFLPESSTSDVNQNVVATTAISNSVNSLLASQINRFANQYVKGVSIDVGIQSYSDYSVPGGKTATAMDFRVTKTILDDRLSFEIGGEFDINSDQSGANTGNKNYRGDVAIVYDITGKGNKQLKLFNNETYDIIYQEVQNTGLSITFIREFNKNKKPKSSIK